MGVTFLSTTDFPSGRITEFNIEAAKDKKNKDIFEINAMLTDYCNLTHGTISQQKDTGDFWYINNQKSVARKISNDQLELFKRWDKEKLIPNDRQLEVLEKIGGLPTSKYSMYPDHLEFPCKIKLMNGDWIDLCIVHFCPAPPFQRYFKKVVLLNDVVDIEPSELSLTHDLRLQSMLADEIRMSFYPFMVKVSDGRDNRHITYNGVTQFASTGEIKGKDVLTQVPFSYDKFDTVMDVSYDLMTFVIGKWDNRLDTLFKDYRKKIE